MIRRQNFPFTLFLPSSRHGKSIVIHIQKAKPIHLRSIYHVLSWFHRVHFWLGNGGNSQNLGRKSVPNLGCIDGKTAKFRLRDKGMCNNRPLANLVEDVFNEIEVKVSALSR